MKDDAQWRPLLAHYEMRVINNNMNNEIFFTGSRFEIENTKYLK